MSTNPGTVTVWQSGRLAPRATARPLQFTREHWLGAALLMASAVVLAMYVAVLRADVDRNDMLHVAQRSRAVAEAQCEANQPAELRGRCIALFNGDVVTAQAPDGATAEDAAYQAASQENAARATTVSLVAAGQ